jgi:ABC-2 type transport system ATP-binding protein
MSETEQIETAPATEAEEPLEVVAVRGLVKVFKDFWGRPKAKAVNDVDFEVMQGEVFGLLGPNGSGKSTIIKMLLGLLNPTKGFIRIFNHSARDVKTKERIGYLPEESYLYKYLDSKETLDFFGGLFALDPREKKRREEQLLEMVGLKSVQLQIGRASCRERVWLKV